MWIWQNWCKLCKRINWHQVTPTAHFSVFSSLFSKNICGFVLPELRVTCIASLSHCLPCSYSLHKIPGPIGHRQSPKDIVKNLPNNHFNQVFCLMFLMSKLTSYLDWLFLHLYLGSDCRQTFWFAVMNQAQIFIVSDNRIFYSMYVVWPLQTTSLNLGDLFPICVSHQALPTRTASCSGFRWFWAILKKNSKRGKNMFLSCCYHSKIKADFSQTRTLPTNQLREASNSNLIVKENFLENDTSHYDCIAKQFGIHI